MKTLKYISVLSVLLISACNSIYVKPHTLDKNEAIFADRGGFSMKRSVKQEMEKRGYYVVVGKSTGSKELGLNGDSLESVDINNSTTMNARYIVKVNERRETFMPVWCIFNGFWWWNFNVSIADQKTGQEILSWRGRGCANSSLSKLDDALDKLEK